jgi:hypothetical protein
MLGKSANDIHGSEEMPRDGWMRHPRGDKDEIRLGFQGSDRNFQPAKLADAGRIHALKQESRIHR